jgi:hypothetical protein
VMLQNGWCWPHIFYIKSIFSPTFLSFLIYFGIAIHQWVFHLDATGDSIHWDMFFFSGFVGKPMPELPWLGMVSIRPIYIIIIKGSWEAIFRVTDEV